MKPGDKVMWVGKDVYCAFKPLICNGDARTLLSVSETHCSLSGENNLGWFGYCSIENIAPVQ